MVRYFEIPIFLPHSAFEIWFGRFETLYTLALLANFFPFIAYKEELDDLWPKHRILGLSVFRKKRLLSLFAYKDSRNRT